MIRYRGVHDAQRAHLLITEDDERGEHHYTLTFGELYSGGAEVRGGTGETRRAGRRARVADAADLAAIFHKLRGNFAGGRGASADLSAISRGPD